VEELLEEMSDLDPQEEDFGRSWRNCTAQSRITSRRKRVRCSTSLAS
jgi:hypothetical protein